MQVKRYRIQYKLSLFECFNLQNVFPYSKSYKSFSIAHIKDTQTFGRPGEPMVVNMQRGPSAHHAFPQSLKS